MNDLSGDVRRVIYEGGIITALRNGIGGLLKQKQDHLVVVVSGWETLRRSTPDSHSKYLDEIVTTIVQTIPANSTVVWFARPVPLAQNNIEYSSRCVAPFYQRTLWQTFADTIVWNVPMPPDRSGARVSTNYHERCIFIERHDEESIGSMVVEIEPLRGWGIDFMSGGQKGRGQRGDVYGRGAGPLSHRGGRYLKNQLKRTKRLIPHLLSDSEYNPRPRSKSSLEIEHVTSGYEKQQDEKAPPRLTFRPYQKHTKIEKADGRIQVLQPIDSINQRREYRQMRLDVTPKRRSTKPPSERLLVPVRTEDREIALAEIRELRDTVRFLRSAGENHLGELLDRLSETLDDTSSEEESGDSDVLINRLRHIRQTLQSNDLSVEVWEQLLPVRSVIPRDLSRLQREHVTAIQTSHPDILMLTGNHLFLLILSAIGSISDNTDRELVSLWEYVRPWHLTGLGLRPVYPKSHRTGRSVLDRHALLPLLRQRFVRSKKSLDLSLTLTDVRFGQFVMIQSPKNPDSNYVWLLFQRTPGVYEMNAALLNPRGIDPSLSLAERVHEMVSEKTLWSESDLGQLHLHAGARGDVKRLDMIVAEQHGVQGFWVKDRERECWIPVGHVHYTTRRHEFVTLVRTISLTEDSQLRPVDLDDVRRPVHTAQNMVTDALSVMEEALKEYTQVTCQVTLDLDERMFRVSFSDKKSGAARGEILINRTVDLLEILRRPDNECEPVVIDGKRLIWNRFKDISYDGDAGVLRPWVDRRDPFPGMSLKTPPSADNLLDADKEFDVTLELYHDPWTCPMRHISLEDIKMGHKKTRTSSDSRYMLRFASHWGEPAHISNEPGLHHGSCWRVHMVTPHTLTTEMRALTQTRFTDGQARSLLSPQELVYWSEREQRWITHTFKLVVQKDCI